MRFLRASALRCAAVCLLTLCAKPLRAEYLHIQIRVFGMDCGLCARGVAAYMGRTPGVKSAYVSWKKGLLDIELEPGNKLKLDDIRKRVRDNGFKPMEANVTAIGRFTGTKFEIIGSSDSYNLPKADANATGPIELTFDVPSNKLNKTL